MQQNFCPDQNDVSSVLHYDVEPAVGFPRNVVYYLLPCYCCILHHNQTIISRKTASKVFPLNFSKAQEIDSMQDGSNEHEQLYSFFRRINDIYDKNHKTLSHTTDNITLKFVENYESYTEEVQSLFEEWDKKANASWKEFKWNVQFFNDTEDGHIFIHILETKNGIPTSGGSSFTFLQTSARTKDFCPITDHFNGTYTVRCAPHENNTVIKGDVHFINLTTFTNKTIISYKTIFQHSQIRLKSSFCGKEHGNKTPYRAYWVLRNNSWHWFTGSHVIPTTQRDTLRQCLHQFTQASVSYQENVKFIITQFQSGIIPKRRTCHICNITLLAKIMK